MRRIGDQFVNVGRAKGPIAFAENNQIRVCIAQRFQVAAVDTAPIARILLIECQGACRFRDLERVVGTVIGDDDHAGHSLVGEEITYCLADTFFVVVGCKCHGYAGVACPFIAKVAKRALLLEKEDQVDERQYQAQYHR